MQIISHQSWNSDINFPFCTKFSIKFYWKAFLNFILMIIFCGEIKNMSAVLFGNLDTTKFFDVVLKRFSNHQIYLLYILWNLIQGGKTQVPGLWFHRKPCFCFPTTIHEYQFLIRKESLFHKILFIWITKELKNGKLNYNPATLSLSI